MAELPINTVIITTLGIIALAAIGIFFFNQMSQNTQTASKAQGVANTLMDQASKSWYNP